MAADTVRFGVVGCGEFARFVVAELLQMPNTTVTAICDPDPNAAEETRKTLGDVALAETPAELAERDDVDVVYVATPPAWHHPHALHALQAGKHVLVEEPLAVTTEQADELLRVAREKGCLLATDLTMRYDPLVDTVKRIIDQQLLGPVMHGSCECCLAEPRQGADHWLWKAELSGGVFVERGVHFFDLFEHWLGDGEVVAAQRSSRPTGEDNQSQCTVRYGSDVLINFYNGFRPAEPIERQTIRLEFERGDILLDGHVPTQLTVRALVNEHTLPALHELLPDATIATVETYRGKDRRIIGRGGVFEADQLVELRSGRDQDKMEHLGGLLRQMVSDQLRWVTEPTHTRRVTELNARNAVATAMAATEFVRRPPPSTRTGMSFV